MNFGGLIARFKTGTHTVTRRGPSVVASDGRVDPATATTFAISASVQVFGGRMLQRRAEGDRVEERKLIYTQTRLQAGSSPDVVAINGENYEVERVEDENDLGRYFKVTALKVGN